MQNEPTTIDVTIRRQTGRIVVWITHEITFRIISFKLGNILVPYAIHSMHNSHIEEQTHTSILCRVSFRLFRGILTNRVEVQSGIT